MFFRLSFSMLIFLFMSHIATANPKYIIMNRLELNKIIQEKDSILNRDYILNYNKAFVFEFKDGTGIILPPALGGDDGILFYDMQSMNNAIQTRQYPIKEGNSFWVRERKRVENIDKELPVYLDKLSKYLNYPIELSFDSQYLNVLSKVFIEQFKSKKVNKDYYYLAGIYVSELVRLRLQGEWKFFPLYSLNMSYALEIGKDGKSCDVVHKVYVALQNIDSPIVPFSLERIINESINAMTAYGKRYDIE